MKLWSNSIVKCYDGGMKTATTYYTPKEVALMFSIQKDTLLFYDRIGLFQPDLRKPNGYRFYSAGQLAELDALADAIAADISAEE